MPGDKSALDLAKLALRPGAPPPWLIPFCASCKEGVEGFTVHRTTIEGVLEVEARCHGKTQGQFLGPNDLARIAVTGIPLVLFRGPLRNLVDAVTTAP